MMSHILAGFKHSQTARFGRILQDGLLWGVWKAVRIVTSWEDVLHRNIWGGTTIEISGDYRSLTVGAAKCPCSEKSGARHLQIVESNFLGATSIS